MRETSGGTAAIPAEIQLMDHAAQLLVIVPGSGEHGPLGAFTHIDTRPAFIDLQQYLRTFRAYQSEIS